MSDIKRINEIIIYESPNGGETVYARTMGSSERRIHREGRRPIITQMEFLEIVKQAEAGDQTLVDLLEQLKIVYELKR